MQSSQNNKPVVFCFGEILMRMSPVLQGVWLQQNQMPVYVGGAELNVATALAKWNIGVKYSSAAPDNYLTEEIIKSLQAKNINTEALVKTGNRIGAYYLPQGTDLKNAGVIYDRAYSSFSELQPGIINWNEALEGCNWFHFSAINPALNENAVAVCKEALIAAKAKGITVSIDLNYRAKLWQYGKTPVSVMPELVQYCDVVMGNIWAAESLLGIAPSIQDSENASPQELVQAAAETIRKIQEQFSQVQTVAFTFRMSEEYYAVIKQGKEIEVSQTFPLTTVVDKVGSGDCFMAGLIYGLLKNNTAKEIINFSAAAAVGKMKELGDATQQTVEEVWQRVKRFE